MKKLILLFSLLTAGQFAHAQVGVNNPTPDASSVLDIAATDKGLLIPRLTAAERTAITSPANGLMVFQTDGSVGFWYYLTSGGWTFLNPAGDNLGNHTLTQNLNTNGKEIKGGLYAGLSIASNGLVSIGSSDRSLNGSSQYENGIGLIVNQADRGFAVTGELGYPFSATLPATGYGYRMMWTPFYAAFRAGGVSGDQWDGVNLGFFSAGFGQNVKAIGNWSIAVGHTAETSGAYAVSMGSSTLASGTASVAIGFRNTASGEYSSATGYRTTASGNYSTAAGAWVSTNDFSGSYIIGDQSVSVSGGTTYSDATNRMTMRFANGYKLFTNSAATVGVTVGAGGNAWSTISDVNRKENFAPVNGEDFLQKIARFNLTSWNYKGQEKKTSRHYGPMAQDFFAAFGTDSYGTIGNDTTINQADFDGINLIAIQALERRTAELKKENELLKARLTAIENGKGRVAGFRKENKQLRSEVAGMKQEMAEIKALLQTPKENVVQANNQPPATK